MIVNLTVIYRNLFLSMDKKRFIKIQEISKDLKDYQGFKEI